MVLFTQISSLSSQHPVLQRLSINQLTLFFSLGRRLYPEIVSLPSPPSLATHPTPSLNHVELFTSSLSISEEDFWLCWEALYVLLSEDCADQAPRSMNEDLLSWDESPFRHHNTGAQAMHSFCPLTQLMQTLSCQKSSRTYQLSGCHL